MDKNIFFLESFRITLFCIGVTLLFRLGGASNQTQLIVFNMAVMSAAATFLPQKKSSGIIILGSSTLVLAILLGGVLGFYTPLFSKMLGVAFAGLAFWLPRRRVLTTICVTSSVMFLIFSSLPFDLQHALHYLLCGVVVVIGFALVHRLFESKIYPAQNVDLSALSVNRSQSALLAVISLLLGWGCAYFLHRYTQMGHLYWVALTILVVIQGSQEKTIKTSLVRIVVNTVGAILTVLLFTYWMPPIFWLNLSVLVLFLFFIFALGFSYVARTLFIELFVLGFTHLLGHYHNVLAYDRVFLTLIGGTIVIVVSLLLAPLYRRLKPSDDLK